MTQMQTNDQKSKSEHTPQQHHLKAAEHLEIACKLHKDAAKHLDSGDHNAAAQDAKMASEHLVKATGHGTDASKSQGGKHAH